MTKKEEFISNKMKILVGKEGYDRKQAYAIANSYWEREHKQEGGAMQDQYSKKMYPLLNKELSYPILKVEPFVQDGVEGYKQYYTDPSLPDADFSFLPKSDYLKKKNAKEGRPDYEPYLQMYLKRTGGKEGINVHYQQAGQFGFKQPTIPMVGYEGSPLSNYNLDSLNLGLEDLQNQELAKQQELNKNTYKANLDALSPEQQSQVQRQADVRAGLDSLDVNNQPSYYDINRVNIANPYGGISLDYALNYAGRGFGTGNAAQAAIGTGLSAIKGARNFLTGFATGREDARVANEFMDKQFDNTRPYTYVQQGGKIKNSDIIAQNAITDNSNGNINLEDGEFVQRNNGQVQPVVGEPHIKNGKVADGVDAKLENGERVLSNYTKLRPSDIKDLKSRYNVSLKKGDTFADAQRKIDSKLGIKKLETEKATLLEKMEKANTIKDTDTRELSVNALLKKVGSVNEKLGTLGEVRSDNFSYLFNLQEEIPKKGDGTQLFDDNGKEVKAEGGKKDYSQQGGELYIQQLAKKHNIPLERAMELVKMQEGGEQQQQQAQMEELFQIVVNALQQGASPEEVVQQMVEQGVPQEAAMQVVQQVVSQTQTEQPMAQQGGRIASRYENPELYRKQNPTSESWESFGELLKNNPTEVLNEIKRIHPELYNKYFPNGKIGSDKTIADFQLAVNKKYDNILSDAEKLYGKDSDKVKELKNQIQEDNFLINDDGIRSVDSKLGNYTSTRPNYQLNVIPEEELKKLKEEGINTAYQLKEKNPELYNKYVKDKGLSSDFWLGEINENPQVAPAQTTQVSGITEQPGLAPLEPRVRTTTVIPNLEPYIPLFNAIQPIAKEQVAFQRLEPVKSTTEPMLAEQERLRQADVARTEELGLSPQQQEALMAQGLSSSQMAANDAISKVEQYNAQNQFQTDQYNLGLGAKEQLQNASFNQNYQDKMMATLANMEESYRNQYRTQYLQGQADRNYITNLNKLNTLSDQFAVTPDGVIALNNRAYQPDNLENKMLEGMTPEQLKAYAEQKTGMLYSPQSVPSKTNTQVTPTNQMVTESTVLPPTTSNQEVSQIPVVSEAFDSSVYDTPKSKAYYSTKQNSSIPTILQGNQGYFNPNSSYPFTPTNFWELSPEEQSKVKKAQLGLKYRGW